MKKKKGCTKSHARSVQKKARVSTHHLIIIFFRLLTRERALARSPKKKKPTGAFTPRKKGGHDPRWRWRARPTARAAPVPCLCARAVRRRVLLFFWMFNLLREKIKKKSSRIFFLRHIFLPFQLKSTRGPPLPSRAPLPALAQVNAVSTSREKEKVNDDDVASPRGGRCTHDGHSSHPRRRHRPARGTEICFLLPVCWWQHRLLPLPRLSFSPSRHSLLRRRREHPTSRRRHRQGRTG